MDEERATDEVDDDEIKPSTSTAVMAAGTSSLMQSGVDNATSGENVSNASMGGEIVQSSVAPLNAYASGTGNSDMATEWMKSVMLPYVSSMFANPGLSQIYRQSAFHLAAQNYRGTGFVPRIRGRGRGRARGRSYYYDGKYPMPYYNNNGGGNANRYNQQYHHYGNYRYMDAVEDGEDEENGHYKSSYSKNK